MCRAPSVGDDGVTTRRFALSKEPCRLARRSAASRAGTGWLIACCSPGVDKRGKVDWAEMPRRLFVPVEITPVAAPIPSAPQPASSPAAQRATGGIIEIELGGGCRVRVDRDVDVEALQRVLELLRRR